MHLKRYRRGTVRDALARARAELGPDALVLSTRLVALRGIRGWLGGREVELTATHDSVMSGSRPRARFADIPSEIGTASTGARRSDLHTGLHPDLHSDLFNRRVHSHGFVAHDPAVRASVCRQQAVVFYHPHSPASLCFRMLASRVAGLRPLGAPGLKPLPRPVTRPEPDADLKAPQCA